MRHVINCKTGETKKVPLTDSEKTEQTAMAEKWDANKPERERSRKEANLIASDIIMEAAGITKAEWDAAKQRLINKA